MNLKRKQTWLRPAHLAIAGLAALIAAGDHAEATDRRGEDVVTRRMSPQDFLATVYRHLGIDWENVALRNFSGRPVPIVTDGRPFPELALRS